MAIACSSAPRMASVRRAVTRCPKLPVARSPSATASRLNQVVNRYLRANWEAIRADLVNSARHESIFGADGPVGDAYVNTRAGQPGGAANPNAVRITGVERVTITIIYQPGAVPPFYVLRTYPNPPGY
ncbi:MAG: hypothetical protein QOF69_1787 [Solirubrobacteraceae bacterium]|nr:hypothetical protein [Solirubrobacteraceae bacterium]